MTTTSPGKAGLSTLSRSELQEAFSAAATEAARFQPTESKPVALILGHSLRSQQGHAQTDLGLAERSGPPTPAEIEAIQVALSGAFAKVVQCRPADRAAALNVAIDHLLAQGSGAPELLAQSSPAAPTSPSSPPLSPSSPPLSPASVSPQRLSRLGSLPKQPSMQRSVSIASSAVSESDETCWLATEWLDGLEVNDLLSEKILREITMKDEPIDPRMERHLMEKLATAFSSHVGVRKMLEQSSFLDELAQKLYNAAAELRQDEDSRRSNEKFQDESTKELAFGQLHDFFRGLDGFIGAPNPNLREAMVNEHCHENDSQELFEAKNYKTKTTPEIEWHFVNDSNNVDRRGELKSKHEEASWDEKTGWPKENPERLGNEASPRSPRLLSSFKVLMATRNGELVALGEEPLIQEELIGGRLYTGPMYCKYNHVLRTIGQIHVSMDDSSEQVTESMIQKQLEKVEKNFSCNGNRYVTTIHVISSCVLRLSKLTKATPVYRGLSGRALPRGMRVPDQYNVRGGVEFGFLSCSADVKVADTYAFRPANDPSAGENHIAFEVQVGMIDRAADIGWLSQYPHEKEYLFAPLTGLERIGDRTHHSMKLIKMRPSVNLSSKTIEHVVGKMKHSVITLTQMLIEDLRFTGAPSLALEQLRFLQAEMESQDPVWFNVAQNFSDINEKLMKCHADTLKDLGDLETWKMSEQSSNRRASRSSSTGRRASVAAKRSQSNVVRALTRTASASVKEFDEALYEASKSSGSQRALGRTSRSVDYSTTENRDLTRKRMLAVAKLCAHAGKADLAANILMMRHQAHIAKEATRGELARGVVQEFAQDGDSSWPSVFAETMVLLAQISDEEQCSESSRSVLASNGESTPHRRRAASAPNRASESSESALASNNGSATRRGTIRWAASEPNAVSSRSLLASNCGSTTQRGLLLHAAASNGDKKLVEALLEHNSDELLDECDANHNNALMYAVRASPARDGVMRHADVVKLLRVKAMERETRLNETRGTDEKEDPHRLIHARNLRGENAFDIVVSKRVPQLTRALLPSVSDAAVEAADESRFREVAHKFVALRKEFEALKDAEEHSSAEQKESLRRVLLRARDELTDATNQLDDELQNEYANGVTPLMMASRGGYKAVAEHVLSQMKNEPKEEPKEDSDAFRKHLNASDTHERSACTALIMAAEAGADDVVGLLLKEGADALATNAKGSTALHMATQYGWESTVDVLLQSRSGTVRGSGHNPALGDSWKRLESSDTGDIVKQILEARGRWGKTPLMVAAIYGQTAIAATLLRAGADPTSTAENGESALYLASRFGHADLVEVLLKVEEGQEKDVNLAVIRPREQMVDMLLDHDREQKSYTPLHAVAKYGHAKVAKLLLDAVSQANRQIQIGMFLNCFHKGTTPLMAASESGHVNIVKQLLNVGAQVDNYEQDDDSNATGPTALICAARSGQVKVLRALLSALRASPADGGVNQVTGTDHQTLWDFVDLSLPVARTPSEARHLCFDASMLRRLSSEHHIVSSQHGGHFNGGEKSNALMEACRNGHAGATTALMQAGADVSLKLKDASGTDYTALDLAVRACSETCVTALLEPTLRGFAIGCEIPKLESRKRFKIDLLRHALQIAEELASKRDVPTNFTSVLKRTSLADIKKLLNQAIANVEAEVSAKFRKRSVFRVPKLDKTGLLQGHVLDQIEELEFQEHDSGQLAPSHAANVEIEEKPPQTGSVVLVDGVAVRKGASQSVWLTVGCNIDAPPSRLWLVLEELIDKLQRQRTLREEQNGSHQNGSTGGDVYLAVSVWMMHTLDVKKLAGKGFKFHHFRPAGVHEVRTPSASTSSSQADATPSSEVAAEFVFTDASGVAHVSEGVAGIVTEAQFDAGPLQKASWVRGAADSWRTLFFGHNLA